MPGDIPSRIDVAIVGGGVVGLASAAALALRQSSVPMDYLAINDVFGESAHRPEDLQVAYGLTPDNIAAKARKLVAGR